jgi:FkbM family methyltransferase
MNTTKTKLLFVRVLFIITKFIYSLAGKNIKGMYKRNGILWELNLSEAIDYCLFLTGKYEPDLMQSYEKSIRPDYVILDIGANMGAHSLPMAKKLSQGGRLYAFEPTQYGFLRLNKNLQLNPILSKRIIPQQIFLSDKSNNCSGVVSASWSVSKSMSDPQRNHLDQGFPCSTNGAVTMTLDQWVATQNLDKISLIKIDVDGYEPKILRGAQETLKRYRPHLYIEFSPIHFEHSQDKFSDLINELKNAGYKFLSLKGKHLSDDTQEIEKSIPRGVLINVLGVPVETLS